MAKIGRVPGEDPRLRRVVDRVNAASAASIALSSPNLTGAGLVIRTGTDIFTTRITVAPAAGLSITNPTGVGGNITFALANDLSALEGLASTGIAVRSATDTWVQRTITGPAAGITVSNGNGVSGNPTLALANDLSAVEGLGATGLATRTAADTWTTRTITGTANQITVSNGNGVSGNPTLSTPQDIHTGATPTFAGLTLTSIVSMTGTTVALTEGVNFTYGTTTGTQHGTAANQKQGIWGATPIVQPAHADQAVVTLVNTNGAIGGLTISAGYDQLEVQALRDATETLADDVRALSTLLHSIRTALVDYGAIKGSA